MVWWGWLLLGVGASALIYGALWLIFWWRSSPSVDRAAITESENKLLKKQLEAVRKAKDKELAAKDKLAETLHKIAADKKKQLGELDEQAQKDYVSLTDDPDALLSHIDEILGGTYKGYD